MGKTPVSGTITVQADSQQKGQEAIVAASKIINAIPHDDLIYLADLAVKKPNFVQKAKPYVSYL